MRVLPGKRKDNPPNRGLATKNYRNDEKRTTAGLGEDECTGFGTGRTERALPREAGYDTKLREEQERSPHWN
ncbi:MAG TPA: hypothetical protein VH681_07210 [Nitrospiraceae bacterium]